MIWHRRAIFLLILLTAPRSSGTAGSRPAHTAPKAYDLWVDFEHDTIGSAMTAKELAASSHGAKGAWVTSQQAGLLTTRADAQCPAHAVTGDAGTRGMQYSSPTGAIGMIVYELPAEKNAVSVGLWYKTGASYPWGEGPHFVSFFNPTDGPTIRLSDERDSLDNERQIRVSPGNSGVTTGRVRGISDNAWYWVTMKFVKGSTGSLSVYDSSLELVGTTTYVDGTRAVVTAVELGNSKSTYPPNNYTVDFDDFEMDTTDAAFPLMPPQAERLGKAQTEGSKRSQVFHRRPDSCSTATLGCVVL
jgi:hypothetical protein